MSNATRGALQGLGLDTEVTPPEAPWHLNVIGSVMKIIKRTATLYALDQGRQASCKECLLQACCAHSRLLKHHGYTPLQLLFGHEPPPEKGEPLDPDLEGLDVTIIMLEKLQRR